MDISSAGLVLVTILFIWYWRKVQNDREAERRNGLKEIPGPKGLPIIGNLHQIGREMNKQLCKMSKEFGDIFQVHLANKR